MSETMTSLLERICEAFALSGKTAEDALDKMKMIRAKYPDQVIEKALEEYVYSNPKAKRNLLDFIKGIGKTIQKVKSEQPDPATYNHASAYGMLEGIIRSSNEYFKYFKIKTEWYPEITKELIEHYVQVFKELHMHFSDAKGTGGYVHITWWYLEKLVADMLFDKIAPLSGITSHKIIQYIPKSMTDDQIFYKQLLEKVGGVSGNHKKS